MLLWHIHAAILNACKLDASGATGSARMRHALLTCRKRALQEWVVVQQHLL